MGRLLSVVLGCALVLLGLVPATAVSIDPVDGARSSIAMGRLAITPGAPIARERATYSSRVPGVGRQVLLQRRTGTRWVRVATARSGAGGVVRLHAALAVSTGLRVYAGATRIGAKSFPTFRGVVRPVRLAAQSGSLTIATASLVLVKLRPVATFHPARPGRPVALQAWTGSSWIPVATAQQDAAGRAVLPVAGVLPGTVSYRAVTGAARGAAATATATRDVRFTSPPVDSDPPVIETTSLPSGTVGVTYAATLAVTDDRHGTWSFVSAPAWLTLNPATGALGGTPGTPGGTNIVVRFVDDDGLVATRTLALTVLAPQPGPPVISTATLPDATSTVGYSTKVLVSDGRPGTWSFVSAPAWLTLNPSSGALGGTPAAANLGTVNVTIKFTDGAGLSSTKTFSLKVGQLPPTVATTSLPTATAGTAYSSKVVTSDGRAGSWSLTAAPGWLTLNPSSGNLSGTPGAGDAGSPTVTVKFTDTTAQTASRTITLTVIPAAPVIDTSSLPDATTGTAYTARVTTADGRAGTWTLLSSPVPPGWLTLNAGSGVLGGTPATADAGAATIAVRFTDAYSRSVTRSLALTVVRGAPNPTPAFWLSITAGSTHTCAVRSDRTAWCWGSNLRGQLGTNANSGKSAPNPIPVQVGTATNWLSLSVGRDHTCGVKADGTAWCWGSNLNGELGTTLLSGTNASIPTPQQVGSATNWTSISAGAGDSCGLRADGTAWCWGFNYYGQLGNSTNTLTYDPNPTPTQVGRGTTWSSVTTGTSHTCGVKADGTAWCWGYNYYGELGGATNLGSINPTTTPVQVGTATNWSSVSAGGHHTCGVKADGTIWCWGWNYYGDLGNPTNNGIESKNPTPVQVEKDTNWSSVNADGFHSCGVKADGTAWCWGYNFSGESGSTSGNGTDLANPELARIGSATNWSGISSGGGHSCGVRADGTAWCWGANTYGQLGNPANSGTSSANPTALPVTTP